MSVKMSRSFLRDLMGAIAEANAPPEPYGPWTEEDAKIIAHNDRVIAEMRESMLDIMPNVDHDK